MQDRSPDIAITCDTETTINSWEGLTPVMWDVDTIQLEDTPGIDISHELRTSLAVITMLSGNLDLLYDRLDDDRRRSMIRDLRKQTKKLNMLVGDILRICVEHRGMGI